jgi:CRP-like cAMP-binding protein
MQDDLKITYSDLRGVNIFANMPEDVLGMIAKLCTLRTYQAGEYLGEQGEIIDQLLIVNSGKIAIEKRIDIHRFSHTLTIAILTRGRVCGWSMLVPPYVLKASIKCLEDTQVIGIKVSELQELYAEKPQIEVVIMRNLAGIISSRLQDTQTQLTNLCAEVLKEGMKYKG